MCVRVCVCEREREINKRRTSVLHKNVFFSICKILYMWKDKDMKGVKRKEGLTLLLWETGCWQRGQVDT